MQKYEWIGFIPTPAEKHEGVAEIRLLGSVTIALRFKIVQKKDGTGYFPACASYRVPDCGTGEYAEAFTIDSRSEHDAIQRFVMQNFMQWKQQNQVQVPQMSYPQPNYAGSNNLYVQNNQPQQNPQNYQQPTQNQQLPF